MLRIAAESSLNRTEIGIDQVKEMLSVPTDMYHCMFVCLFCLYVCFLFVVFELANAKNAIVQVHVTTIGSKIYNKESDGGEGWREGQDSVL